MVLKTKKFLDYVDCLYKLVETEGLRYHDNFPFLDNWVKDPKEIDKTINKIYSDAAPDDVEIYSLIDSIFHFIHIKNPKKYEFTSIYLYNICILNNKINKNCLKQSCLEQKVDAKHILDRIKNKPVTL